MDTLGVVESKTIASGVDLADRMLKAAHVDLLRASSICSGRYLIYVSGDRGAVETAVTSAVQSGRSLFGNFVISNVSQQVMNVLKRSSSAQPGEALGVVECRSVAAGIAAADTTIKKAQVRLLRIVTGQGINGKSYFVVSGDVASVEEAVDTAKEALGQKLVDAVVLPRPEEAVVRALTGGVR